MVNLVAYIPVLNKRHVEWFARHGNEAVRLYLIGNVLASNLVNALHRNVGALPTWMMAKMLRELSCPPSVRDIIVLSDAADFDCSQEYILADEDVCHELVGRFSNTRNFKFENIWARWDMSAVKAAQPVIPDCEVSTLEVDIFRIVGTEKISRSSPDWWRQIGAAAFRGDEVLAFGWNQHFPTEYETDMFSDPRINFNAGDPVGIGVYLSLHAEESIICFCAQEGIALKGASLYINTFPCGNCARAVAKAGFKELFFREGSSFLSGFEILKNAGVRIVQVREDPVSA